MAFRVVLDACVLIPYPLCELLLRLGKSGLFQQLRWESVKSNETVGSVCLELVCGSVDPVLGGHGRWLWPSPEPFGVCVVGSGQGDLAGLVAAHAARSTLLRGAKFVALRVAHDPPVPCQAFVDLPDAGSAE